MSKNSPTILGYIRSWLQKALTTISSPQPSSSKPSDPGARPATVRADAGVRTYEFQDVFTRELLYHLTIRKAPPTWRLRKVEKLRPRNLTSYESKISYQLVVPSSFVHEVFQHTLDFQDRIGKELIGIESHPITMQRKRGELRIDVPLRIILPVCLLPKRVLLDFSVYDQGGDPLILKTRFDGSALTREVLATGLEILGLRDFYNSCHRLLHSFIFMAPRNVAKTLAAYRVPLHPIPPYDRYEPKLRDFITNSICRYFVNGRAPGEAIEALFAEQWDRIANALALSSCLINRTRQARLKVWDHGFHNPLINPLMACLDYYKLAVRDRPDYQGMGDAERTDLHQSVFRSFIDECSHYLQFMDGFANDRFGTIYDLLRVFSEFYFAYVNVTVIPDEEFLIKIEQTVPTASWPQLEWSLLYDRTCWPRLVEWHQWRKAFRRHYQVYPIVLGDTQTTHLEVETKIPTELEQVHKRTRIEIKNTKLKTGEIFGYASDPRGEAKDHQHFYTTKTILEVRNILKNKGILDDRPIAEGIDLDLLVKFRANWSILWIYGTTALLAIALTFHFLCSFGPHLARTDIWTEVTKLIIPLILAIIALLARLRPQQSITADVLKLHSTIIAVCATFVILWFVISLFSPWYLERALSPLTNWFHRRQLYGSFCDLSK